MSPSRAVHQVAGTSPSLKPASTSVYDRDRVWVGACPRCGEPVLVGNVDGLDVRISRKSIPFSDAFIITRYGHQVYNIWIDKPPFPRRFWAVWWNPSPHAKTHPPSRGWLFTDHVCWRRP